jgi:hypothetical protein
MLAPLRSPPGRLALQKLWDGTARSGSGPRMQAVKRHDPPRTRIADRKLASRTSRSAAAPFRSVQRLMN